MPHVGIYPGGPQCEHPLDLLDRPLHHHRAQADRLVRQILQRLGPQVAAGQQASVGHLGRVVQLRRMRLIGTIVQLQVQRVPLKVGVKPRRRYDSSEILPVASLALSTQGVVGTTTDGEQVVDVHHADHPASHNSQLLNGISIGFTSHYRAMADRFGAHLSTGIAGENVIVETDERITRDHLTDRITFQTAEGAVIQLQDILVAEPCVEFSRFALHSDESSTEAMSTALSFLRDGMRGFYVTYVGESAVLRPGDGLYVDL